MTQLDIPTSSKSTYAGAAPRHAGLAGLMSAGGQEGGNGAASDVAGGAAASPITKSLENVRRNREADHFFGRAQVDDADVRTKKSERSRNSKLRVKLLFWVRGIPAAL